MRHTAVSCRLEMPRPGRGSPEATCLGGKALLGLPVTAQVTLLCGSAVYPQKSCTQCDWNHLEGGKGAACSKLGIWLKYLVQWTVTINNTNSCSYVEHLECAEAEQ